MASRTHEVPVVAPSGEPSLTGGAWNKAQGKTLEEVHATVIVLREMEGLSHKEIAEVTSVPIGTVMSRLARARQSLTILLAEKKKRGQL